MHRTPLAGPRAAYALLIPRALAAVALTAVALTALPLAACDDGAADPDAAVDHPDARLPDGGPIDGAPLDATLDRDLGLDADPGPDAALDGPLPDAAPLDADLPDLDPDAAAPRVACATSYRAPVPTGQLADPDLVEASGLVPSPTRPGVLWMHTDSGGEPRLYAVDTTGALRGSVGLPVDNIDFEDIAAADCPDHSGPCIWVADTGDNRRERETVWIYAVPEPVVVAGEAARVWRYPVTYPGGPVDSEALAVARDGSTFYLFEKVDGPEARVFAHPGPLRDSTLAQMVEIARFPAPGVAIANGRSITGADLHPTGERLLLRVYTGSYEYRFAPGQGLADLATITPLTVAFGPLSEPQGEAIAYDADGIGIWTVSEDPEGVGQPLNHYDCRD